jgi:exonuclease SbcC
MKNIIFNKLTIKNFLSIGPDPIVIDFKEGINYITGENLDVQGTNNGSGKSSIIDAFNFAIFGESLREVNLNQLTNNLSRKQTEVILEFTCESSRGKNNFKITRTLSPSSCTVQKDGRDKTRDSISNTTKYILEVLSATPDVFKNCIIMRANNTIPFMAQRKPDKKKFIEGIFNLDVLTKMARAVKDDINLEKRDLDVEEKLKYQTETNLKTYEDRYNDIIKANQEAREQSLKQKSEITEKIKNLSDKEKILKEKVESSVNISSEESTVKAALDKAKETQLALSSKLGSIKGEQKSLMKDLKVINEHGAVCPECKRPFDKDDLDKLEEERKKLQDRLDQFKATEFKLYELQDKADNIVHTKQKELSKLRDLKYEQQHDKDQLEHIRELIESYQKNLKTLDNVKVSEDNSVLLELINSTKKERDEKNGIITAIKERLSKYEVAKFILSEEGVRAYIIKKLLDLLNFRIKYYLTKQNSQYSLSFDEMFDDEIINKRGLIVSYYSLSGAEAKMLDLACIWAFRDILKLQGSVSYNVAFYDEILDSSMDSTNSEIVCSILNEIARQEHQATYVITHKTELMKGVSGEVIRLQKQNGITRRSDG